MSTQPWVIEAIRELAERVGALEKGVCTTPNESPANAAWNRCVAAGVFPEHDEGAFWRYLGRQGRDPLQLVLDSFDWYTK